jgi:hypothetical protein
MSSIRPIRRDDIPGFAGAIDSWRLFGVCIVVAEGHEPTNPQPRLPHRGRGCPDKSPTPPMDDGVAARPKITRRRESQRAAFVECPRAATGSKDRSRGADSPGSRPLVVNPSEIRGFGRGVAKAPLAR